MLKDTRLFQPDGKVRAPVITSLEMPGYIIKNLCPEQEVWMADCLYPQIGFYDERRMRGIQTSIASAMTLYDISVCQTGSDDPESHPTFNWPDDDVLAAKRDIGNSFRSGVAWLCPKLLSLRIEILVKARAIILNRDPEVEYQKFKKSAGVNFVNAIALP